MDEKADKNRHEHRARVSWRDMHGLSEDERQEDVAPSQSGERRGCFHGNSVMAELGTPVPWSHSREQASKGVAGETRDVTFTQHSPSDSWERIGMEINDGQDPEGGSRVPGTGWLQRRPQHRVARKAETGEFLLAELWWVPCKLEVISQESVLGEETALFFPLVS